MEDRKSEEKDRYKKAKESGEPFFPGSVFKDLVVSCVVFILLIAFAIKFGAELQSPADPTDTSYNPRPEWYFLFMFQALKFFPGKLEPIAAVVLPGLAVLVLMILPFLDRSRFRHPFDRPILTSFAILIMIGLVYLTVQGARSPMTNVTVERDPVVMAGKRLFEGMKCNYCHSIDGKGGFIGPDLSSVGSNRDENWLINHLKNPQSVTPGSVMPEFNLMDEELTGIVAYLKSLSSGGGPFTAEAKTIYVENCAMCHKLNSVGEDVGPDLSIVGSYRDKTYLYKYIEDPTQLNPDSTMMGYKDALSSDQIEDLARYLAAQKGKGNN